MEAIILCNLNEEDKNKILLIDTKDRKKIDSSLKEAFIELTKDKPEELSTDELFETVTKILKKKGLAIEIIKDCRFMPRYVMNPTYGGIGKQFAEFSFEYDLSKIVGKDIDTFFTIEEEITNGKEEG